MTRLITTGLLVSLLSFGCGSDGPSSRSVPVPPPTPPTQPPPAATFHCSNDATCPEKFVINDPHAGDPFRGYGDPSLEYDPVTGELWMSYSWLNIEQIDPGPPAESIGAVRTHLARSTDNGLTFEFVRSINAPQIETQPDTGDSGLSRLEVSTLARKSDGTWEMMWLKVLDLVNGDSDGVQLWRSVAGAPAGLGDQSEPWIAGAAISPGYNVPNILSDLPELSQCAAFTEPSLFVDGAVTYLAVNCVVSDANGVRNSASEQLVLLRENGSGYSFAGTLTDGLDAVNLGGDRLEQAEISVARDGTKILILSPVVDGIERQHNGCVVLEFSDIATATLRRDADGFLIQRYAITADGIDIGAGLCSYDPVSETGILIVVPRNGGAQVVYALRETGVHP